MQLSTKWDKDLEEHGIAEDPCDSVIIHEEMSAKTRMSGCDKNRTNLFSISEVLKDVLFNIRISGWKVWDVCFVLG